MNLRFPLRELGKREGCGSRRACHRSGRLDDRRGNGAAVDMRAAAPEWLTSSAKRNGSGRLLEARNKATARLDRRDCRSGLLGYHKRWPQFLIARLSRIVDLLSSRRWVFVSGALGGGSPADGGVSATLALAKREDLPR